MARERPFRVAMIAPPWLKIPPGGYGGIENVIAALVPELLDLGVEVELFTTGDSTLKTTKNHWLYRKGQYEHIHRPQYDSAPIVVAHLQAAINKIRASRKGFNVIHDHNNYFGPLAFSQAGDSLPPVINTLHNPRFVTNRRIDGRLSNNKLMWQQLSRAKNLSYVPISEAQAKKAPTRLRPLILPVVHNAVEAKNFPFVERYDKEDYFITLARHHPEKGQHLAVEACAELGLPLKLAGPIGDINSPRKLMLELGNPSSQYRSLTDFRYFSDRIFPLLDSGRIDYVGEVSGKKKLNFITKARALLFPVQWDEPFGMAPIEALACGTPVIAMRRGALPEIIEHGVNGFLADTYAEFKQYLNRIEEIDPATCRASVEEKFSARNMAEKYLQHYETVAKKRR